MTFKKIIIYLLLLIIILGGGYFVIKKFTKSSPISTPPSTSQEENWGQISQQFTDQPTLIKSWKDNGFTRQQCKEWIEVGAEPNDASFARWLERYKNQTPQTLSDILFNINYYREEWENWDDYYSNIGETEKEILEKLRDWLEEYDDFDDEEMEPYFAERQKINCLIRDLQEANCPNWEKQDKLKTFLFESRYFNYEDREKYEVELNRLLEKWKKEESEQKEWFSSGEDLTAEEIDWALNLTTHNSIKILPAHLFSSIIWKERGVFFNVYNNNYLPKNSVRQLLEHITGAELVFIPVINPENNRWSLIVYEDKKKLFYHYESEWDDSYNFAEPLLKEMVAKVKHLSRSDLQDTPGSIWESFIQRKNYLSIMDSDFTGGIEDYSLTSSQSGLLVISIVRNIVNSYRSQKDKSKLNLTKAEEELKKYNFEVLRKHLEKKHNEEKK
jgi:hypothetical protein